jgi:PAS domain S-box-containing protein
MLLHDTRSKFLLLPALVILLVGLIFCGYLYLANYAKEYSLRVGNSLATVSELKASELSQWRKERLNDAGFFYNNAEFSALVKRYLSHTKDVNAEYDIRLLMTKVYTSYNYDGIFLLDKKNSQKLVICDGKDRFLSYVSQQSIDSARTGKIIFEDFYYNQQNKQIYLKIVVPIFGDNIKHDVVGTVVLRINPDYYLYSFIQRWPSNRNSGETYLVRRDGSGIVFLTPLRFMNDAALTLRFDSEKNKDMVAAKAAAKKEGIVEGLDYRGVEVLADVRAIPDSPWLLITKMDKSELYSSYRERQWTVSIAMILLLISIGTTTGFSFKHNRERYLLAALVAEKELHKSEANLSITLNAIGDGVISTNVDGTIVHVNPAAEKLCGWPMAEAQGKPLCEVFNIIDPKTRQVIKNPVMLIMEHGEMIHLADHTVLVSKDGNEYQISDSASPIKDERGHIIGVVLVFSDVTEKFTIQEALRESEAKWHTLFEMLPVGVSIVDAHNTVSDANTALSQILDLSKEALLKGDYKERKYLRPDKMPMSREEFPSIRAVKEQTTIRDVEIGIEKDNGEVIWTSISATTLSPGGSTATVTVDVTDRKRAEEEIKKLLKEKELLLREVHHRIKNNMNTVMALLTLQAETLSDSQVIEALLDARSRLHSMSVLYDKLYHSTDFHDISVLEYLSPLADEIVRNFPNAGIVTVEKHIEDFTLVVKKASPLGIILNELLTNSMKYAFIGRKSGAITISASLKENRVTFVVQDDGIGIPESTHVEGSTGFGTKLIEMLTEQLDGTVRIEREHGTKFILEFKA